MPLANSKLITREYALTNVPVYYITFDPNGTLPNKPIRISRGLSFMIFELDLNSDYNFAASPFVVADAGPPRVKITTLLSFPDQVVLQVVNFKRPQHKNAFYFDIFVIKKTDPDVIIRVDPEVIFEDDPDSP